MKIDLVKRQDVYEMLNDIGGCGAQDEYFKGWDKAIDGAIYDLAKIPSAGSDLIRKSDVVAALKKIFEERRIEELIARTIEEIPAVTD